MRQWNLRRLALILALVLALGALVPAMAVAEGDSIDASAAASGTFSVTYYDGSGDRIKVGVRKDAGTIYYDYTPGSTAQFSFTEGSGTYTVAIYRNITGASYSLVESKRVTVQLSDVNRQYLSSVTEISFSTGDSVCEKAAELCKDADTDEEKIIAIYNYMVKNFSYDYDFARRVIAGEIKSYTPSPKDILSNKKGVCYDFSSLFAAMCRSQGIPCKLVKGYATNMNGYHAWNSVYNAKNGTWVIIDLTYDIVLEHGKVKKLSSAAMDTSKYSAKTSI